jgi:hypothetical protein
MHLLTHEGLYLAGCVAARSRDAQVGGSRRLRFRHEASLLESPFDQLEKVGVIERRVVPIERLVDRRRPPNSSGLYQAGLLSTC